MKNLSLREQDIYDLIVLENLSFDDIAKRLFIEVSTVKAHWSKIRIKTECPNRASVIFDFYKENDMILKLANQLEKLMAKKDAMTDKFKEKRAAMANKIKELANKLLALIEKTEAQIAKAKEVLKRVADM